MDILEKGYPNKKIIDVMMLLRFNNNVIQLVGTSGLKSQLYPADYDFMSKITNKLNTENSFLEFQRILNNIDDRQNLFFVEFKFQLKNDIKHKIFKLEDFTKDTFYKYFNNKIEYCKIDLIYNQEGYFKEVSCIYFFSNEELDKKEYMKALLKDVKDYYNEGDYYKSLKRLFSVAKSKNPPDEKLMVEITKLFNSQVGKLYQKKNEIDASIIFMDKYKDDDNLFNSKLIKMFIKNIGLKNMSPNKLPELSEAYNDIINREALKFYEKNKSIKDYKIEDVNTIHSTK
jgi:hypothetical protein